MASLPRCWITCPTGSPRRAGAAPRDDTSLSLREAATAAPDQRSAIRETKQPRGTRSTRRQDHPPALGHERELAVVVVGHARPVRDADERGLRQSAPQKLVDGALARLVERGR